VVVPVVEEEDEDEDEAIVCKQNLFFTRLLDANSKFSIKMVRVTLK
jgi:hypothetical protein